ncbi:MAG: TerC/Alx family metal homeostasis membrane protein [Candidatus Kapaibacterium sp.]
MIQGTNASSCLLGGFPFTYFMKPSNPDKEAPKPLQRAILWSLFWIGVALLSALVIWLFLPHGGEDALAFLAGYLIEESLSVDNLFVFLMLFTYFKIAPGVQRRVLNYGIIGVIVLRGLMIFVGIGLVNRFEFLMYIFGAIVLYTAVTMFIGKEKEFEAEKSIIIKWVRKFFTISNEFHGDKFFIRRAGKLIATPLFVVIVVVEVTDLLFALDSIPAIFAVTREPLIIYGSNILAVLGLRSFYFLLEHMRSAFRFVQKGVGVILTFVGAKMIAPLFWKDFSISTLYSLIIILGILLLSILASLMIPEKKGKK